MSEWRESSGRDERKGDVQCDAMRCDAVEVGDDDDEEGIESRGKSIGRATKWVCVCVCVRVRPPTERGERC